MNVFCPADILLPNDNYLDRWSVIACDQFTSDPEYWARVRRQTGGIPSTMHMILPEAELGSDHEAEAVSEIQKTMDDYLAEKVMHCIPHAYIYVERTLLNGMVRPGLIGMVDLEQYDYHHNSTSLIRATEKTVLERIPPRQRVRRGAALEFPHIIMLCDDDQKELIEPIQKIKNKMPKLYDLDLMEGGGHLTGWLVQDEAAAAFDSRFHTYFENLDQKYPDLTGAKVLLAVGDGNHSLATAKSCYEELKRNHPEMDFSSHPARYALVELENIHDPSLTFEPIHRVITNVDSDMLIADLEKICKPGGYPVSYMTSARRGVLELDRELGELDVVVLQQFLDEWLKNHAGSIDYIHGEQEVCALSAADDTVGFLLQPMEKGQLFRGVISGGILPRKTFSMGHAREKRYYLEGRKIR